MKTRILFGSVMIVALAALLWWDHHLEAAGAVVTGLPLAGLTVVLLTVGYVEFARLAAAVELPAMKVVGIVGSSALALTPIWRQTLVGGALGGAELVLEILAGVVGLSFLAQMARRQTQGAIRRVAGTLMGVLYLGGLAAFLLMLRIRFSMAALIMVLAAVKGTDIGAYFTGSFLGKHKMIPWLSPGKSWEGLAGGLIVAAAVAVILNAATGVGLCWSHAALLGAVLGAVGQFGDLCESLLKRDAGLKDSASLIPEFGGVLDLVDSPLIAAPVGYLLLAVLLV